MAPITPVSPAVQPASAAPQPVEYPDVRLIIEESDHPGSYIYKTLDRRTGEILQQFPREELLKLREEEAYEAGTVIKSHV